MNQPDYRQIKFLLWVYFILLLTEGALRKWITPGLSTPLLIIRDPVVIAIYVLAFNQGIFPIHNRLIKLLAIITIASCFISLLSSNFNLYATMYGVHTNFLHFPLILVMGTVLNLKDVITYGKAMLILSIPMVWIVVNQFEANPDDIINTTAGGTGRQLETAGGKVRASGTFTFISGIVFFYAFVTAILIAAYITPKKINKILIIIGLIATLLAMVTSGSRAVVAACLQVVACFAFVGFYQVKAFGRLASFAIIAVLTTVIISQTEIFKEGFYFLNLRFDEATNVEGTPVEAYINRNFAVILAPFRTSFDVPLFGLGYGTGTNAGAAFSGGFFGENEWGRNIMESGPILGNLFILWRIYFCSQLLQVCITQTKKFNFYPIFLFGAAGPLILWEQIGQPTTLGFAAFGGGLCLASIKTNK